MGSNKISWQEGRRIEVLKKDRGLRMCVSKTEVFRRGVLESHKYFTSSSITQQFFILLPSKLIEGKRVSKTTPLEPLF